MTAIMALDIGEKRIGIALSQSGVLATPHSILIRKSKKEDFARLQQLVKALGITRLVVGLPYSLAEGPALGPQARRIKRYAEALARTLDIPLEFFDESYSTLTAEQFLANSGRRKVSGAGRPAIDDVAAAVILQNYLNAGRPRKKSKD
jgi:putative Holliday junction resolvase